jgi:transporter family-2 protein
MIGLFSLGIVAGAMITVQSVLNASLGGRAGLLGSVLLLTLVSIAFLIVLVLLFPSTANFRSLPGLNEWYLYLGGVLGILILAAPILLIPRLGAALSLTAVVLGQLTLAVVIDHFGLLAAPKVEAGLLRNCEAFRH